MDPGSSPDTRHLSTRDAILEEHATLRAIVKELRHATELAILKNRLEALAEILPVHFAREEGDAGLTDIVVDRAPWHLPHVEEALDEHGVLLARVGGLLTRVNELLEITTPGLLADAAALAASLAHHEEVETDILCDAFEIDTGGGD
jgi:hypothetical protein